MAEAIGAAVRRQVGSVARYSETAGFPRILVPRQPFGAHEYIGCVQMETVFGIGPAEHLVLRSTSNL